VQTIFVVKTQDGVSGEVLTRWQIFFYSASSAGALHIAGRKGSRQGSTHQRRGPLATNLDRLMPREFIIGFLIALVPCLVVLAVLVWRSGR